VKNADRCRDRPDDQRNATPETFAHRPLGAASKNREGCKVEMSDQPATRTTDRR
jgi:hypothetical protein